MVYYWLFLGILAVWRVTHLLHAEDGPWDLLARFRGLFGDGPAGRLLDCFYCLSLWVAIPAAWLIGRSWKERLFLWPALSAGAILCERIGRDRAEAPVASWHEDGEDEHVVLRRQEGADSSRRSGGPGLGA